MHTKWHDFGAFIFLLFVLPITQGLRSHFWMIPLYILHISRVFGAFGEQSCVPAEGSGEAFFGVVGLRSFLRRLGTSPHVYFTVVEEDRGAFSMVPPLFLSQAANVGCIHRGGR